VAVSADTSSAAAGSTPVVGAAAAVFSALIVVPIPAKVVAVALSASGCVVTNDIGNPFERLHMRTQAREYHTPASEFVDRPRSIGIWTH